jgi:hypothetical protein
MKDILYHLQKFIVLKNGCHYENIPPHTLVFIFVAAYLEKWVWGSIYHSMSFEICYTIFPSPTHQQLKKKNPEICYHTSTADKQNQKTVTLYMYFLVPHINSWKKKTRNLLHYISQSHTLTAEKTTNQKSVTLYFPVPHINSWRRKTQKYVTWYFLVQHINSWKICYTVFPSPTH